MKNLIYSLSFIGLFLFGSTLFGNEAKAQQTQIMAGQTALSNHYGKEMKIISHKKGMMNVDHTDGDYMKFKMDKSYVQSFNGTIKRGTWEYDQTTKTYTITFGVGGTKKYTVETVTATKVILTSNAEKISLEP